MGDTGRLLGSAPFPRADCPRALHGEQVATGASASVPSGPATRCGKRLISHPGAWFPSWKADGREGHRVRPCPTRAARPRAQGKSVDVTGREDGGPLGCAPSRLCSVRPPCVAASAESPRGLGWVSPSGRQNRDGDGRAEAWGALPVLRVVRSLALDAGCSHGGGGHKAGWRWAPRDRSAPSGDSR